MVVLGGAVRRRHFESFRPGIRSDMAMPKYEEGEFPALVVSLGTSKVKIGYCGPEDIRFPSVFDADRIYPSYNYENPERSIAGLLVGRTRHEAHTIYERLLFSKLFHLFNKYNPFMHPILVTESCSEDTSSRNWRAEVLFEEFQVPSLHFNSDAFFTSYWYDQKTGIVVDCGHSYTTVVAIYEGRRLPHGCVLPYGGLTIIKGLQKLLDEEIDQKLGHPTAHMMSLFNDLKEDLWTRDYSYFMPGCQPQPITIDPTIIGREIFRIGRERFAETEVLFSGGGRPFLIGIPQAVVDCAMKQKDKRYRDLLQHVMLSGGTTGFPNFDTRLKKDIVKAAMKADLYADVAKAKECIHVERKLHCWYSSWLGAQLIAKKRIFYFNQVISRIKYLEVGTRHLYEVCKPFSETDE